MFSLSVMRNEPGAADPRGPGCAKVPHAPLRLRGERYAVEDMPHCQAMLVQVQYAKQVRSELHWPPAESRTEARPAPCRVKSAKDPALLQQSMVGCLPESAADLLPTARTRPFSEKDGSAQAYAGIC